jgi:hypothetical protein
MGFYLTQEQLTGNLRLGKSVEQWIGHAAIDDYIILKWLRIDKEKTSDYSVAYFQSFDEGSREFIDIYEFSAVDPDDMSGVIHSFPEFDEALRFAVENYAASLSKFVSAGMIQQEYLNYLNSKPNNSPT